MGYKIVRTKDGEICSCADCGSEVPLDEFSSDRETKFLCEFCANTCGWPDKAATKATLCQAMNILYEKLKK